MSRRTIQILNKYDRDRVAHWAANVPEGSTVEFRAPRRSLDQNALMWSLLEQISQQVKWYNQKLTPEDWKDLASASLRRARFVPGLDAGTFVPLGMRTSQMTKEELSDLIEVILAFGAEKGIKFREYADAQPA